MILSVVISESLNEVSSVSWNSEKRLSVRYGMQIIWDGPFVERYWSMYVLKARSRDSCPPSVGGDVNERHLWITSSRALEQGAATLLFLKGSGPKIHAQFCLYCSYFGHRFLRVFPLKKGFISVLFLGLDIFQTGQVQVYVLNKCPQLRDLYRRLYNIQCMKFVQNTLRSSDLYVSPNKCMAL